jgi:hypothetical protein
MEHWWSLIIFPLGILGLIWMFTAIAGVAEAPNCNVTQIFAHIVIRTHSSSVSCRSVPFTADIPSGVLCVTSASAVSIYFVFAARLRTLMPQLVDTGLVDQDAFTKQPLLHVRRALERGVQVKLGIRFASYILCLGLGVALYRWTYLNGEIFKNLATLYPAHSHKHPSPIDLRNMWWANYHSHPWLAAIWIIVGATGTYYAARQGYTYMIVGTFVLRVRKLFTVNYVPKWLDRDYGWRPLPIVISTAYIGALNFVISYTAVLYLLRGPGTGGFRNILLVLIAVIGVSANSIFLLTIVFTIRTLHQSAVRRELSAVNTDMLAIQYGHRVHNSERAYALVYAIDLVNSPQYPIQRRWVRIAVSAASGLLAIARLIAEIRKLV